MSKENLLIIITMILIGCKPSNEEVVGIYYAKHDLGKEYIKLKSDHTYEHYFKNDSIEKQQIGKWKFENDGKNLKFVMYDWITYTVPGFPNHKSIGKKSIAIVFNDGNKIEFWDNYEYNFYK